MGSRGFHETRQMGPMISYFTSLLSLDQVRSEDMMECSPWTCVCMLLLQRTFESGQTVWTERGGADLFYIIKEGAALLKDSSGAVLSKLGPGGHFGQQSLLGPGQ